MWTGVLFGVHPRARGEVVGDAAGVQTGDVADPSSVVQVFSPEIPFDHATLEKYGWGGTLCLYLICYTV